MKEQVLIIDNNLYNLKQMSIALEKEGMDVWKVADAETALLIVAKIQPPIILLEMYLPKMDSITFARILKNDKETQRAVIIALIDYETQNKPDFSLDTVFDACITKPIDYEKIYSKIKFQLQNNNNNKKNSENEHN